MTKPRSFLAASLAAALTTVVLSACGIATPAEPSATNAAEPEPGQTETSGAAPLPPAGSSPGIPTSLPPNGANPTVLQQCPVTDPIESARTGRFEFPVSKVAHAATWSGEQEILIVRLGATLGPLRETDYGNSPTPPTRSVPIPTPSQTPAISDIVLTTVHAASATQSDADALAGPWATYQGNDGPDPTSWTKILRTLYGVDSIGHSESLIHLATQDFNTTQVVRLAAITEAPEPITCHVARIAVPAGAPLLSTAAIQPGALGGTRVGTPAATLAAQGLIERRSGTWRTTDSISERGIFFLIEQDRLQQIDVDPQQGVSVDSLGISTTARKLRDSGAIHLTRATPQTPGRWVLFGPAGALTLWLSQDGTITRASATTGIDRDTYTPPRSGM